MLELNIQKHFEDFALEIGPPARILDAGVTVLFGPSGAGKTLTLDCIAGFTSPGRGRILIDGGIVFDRDAGVNLPPQRRGCGYVFQNYALFPHMTLRENLEFATPDHSQVRQMLDRFRLGGVANQKPHQLSGGQKQRGSIARALLANPRILLLDEPSRGLDAELRAEFYAVLRQVRQEFGTPMLLVSHDLDECFELAGQMLILDRGRIVQSGPPADLLARPANVDIARLFGCFNVFEAEVTGLNAAKNWSRVRAGDDFLEMPFLAGADYGDRVWLGIRTNALRAWPRAERVTQANQVAAVLERAFTTPTGCRLEFEGGLRIDAPANQAGAVPGSEWAIEFPFDSLIALPQSK